MVYCRELKFEEKPNYNYLRELFDQQFMDLDFKLDYEWCWHIHKKQILSDKIQKEEEDKQQAEINKLAKIGKKSLNKREL